MEPGYWNTPHFKFAYFCNNIFVWTSYYERVGFFFLIYTWGSVPVAAAGTQRPRCVSRPPRYWLHCSRQLALASLPHPYSPGSTVVSLGYNVTLFIICLLCSRLPWEKKLHYLQMLPGTVCRRYIRNCHTEAHPILFLQPNSTLCADSIYGRPGVHSAPGLWRETLSR